MEAFMQTVTYKAGDTILSEGDEGNTAFFIVSGSVEVSIGRGATARTVGMLGAGEVFGEMCLIDPGPRSATVRAATDVECLATSYEDFIASIEDHPERAVGFLKTLVRRLRQMNELMERTRPEKGGLRAMFADWRKSTEPFDIDPDLRALSWTMLW
jgi:CRP-like cAMP-binding protein